MLKKRKQQVGPGQVQLVPWKSTNYMSSEGIIVPIRATIGMNFLLQESFDFPFPRSDYAWHFPWFLIPCKERGKNEIPCRGTRKIRGKFEESPDQHFTCFCL